MFEILCVALFSVSANLDNIPIGLSYGVRKVHISIIKNIIICIFTSCTTFLSMLIGQNISNLFNIKFANIIGSFFLILLGAFPLLKKSIHWKNYKKINNENLKSKIMKSNSYISSKELFTMILTLSLNNIASGFAASITGINTFFTTLFTFIFGSTFLFIGNNLGKKINNKIVEKYSDIISSLILILIGIVEIFI